MDMKFTFIERIKTLFGAPADEKSDHRSAAGLDDIQALQIGEDLRGRKHVPARANGNRLMAQIGTVFVAGESNRLWSKNRENDEGAAHTPSNLR